MKFAALIACVLAGCASTAALRGRIRGVEDQLEQAEADGALRCAPRELALARAHSKFANIELDQGNSNRARDHFMIAAINARAATTLSPPERCNRTTPVDSDADGIEDGADACPTEPEDLDGVEDEDGCPEDQDTDSDGVSDSRDQCVDEPEDRDGRNDEDGCPDLDDDQDGIPDTDDACPTEAEDLDGFEDENGCPDADNDQDGFIDASDRCPNEAGPDEGCPRVYQDVEVTSSGIVIRQQIFFETGRDTIREVSYGILNTVAGVLRDFPDIRIEIQGHTDSQGSDSRNLRLSQARAEAVRAYLIGHGVSPDRMIARGYGETMPIESNRTSSGRAANRRVEFRRTDSAAATPVPANPASTTPAAHAPTSYLPRSHRSVATLIDYPSSECGEPDAC